MNTTNYTIELLITGICSTIWIAFICATVLGDQIPIELLEIGRANMIILALFLVPIIYVFGVIIDRVLDEVPDVLFRINTKEKKDYRNKRSIIYMHSEQLIDIYEYGRMRIRICRNWVFNGSLILICGAIYLWFGSTQFIDISTKYSVTIVLGLPILISIILAYYGHVKLVQSERNFLDIQDNIIRSKLISS